MTWVSLRFSEEPLRFELLQDDKVLWQESAVNGEEFESSFPVSIDEFGTELILRSLLPAAGVIEITVDRMSDVSVRRPSGSAGRSMKR